MGLAVARIPSQRCAEHEHVSIPATGRHVGLVQRRQPRPPRLRPAIVLAPQVAQKHESHPPRDVSSPQLRYLVLRALLEDEPGRHARESIGMLA